MPNPSETQMEARGLRVLSIAPTSFFADYGCHVRILQQTLALQDRGHQVQVLTYPTGWDVPGVEASRARGWPGLREVQIGPRPAKIPLDAALLAHSLAFARRWRPDVICGYLHEGALIGWLTSRVLRVPLAFDFQGSLVGELAGHGWLKRRGAAYGFFRRLERWIHGLPDVIMCSSQHAVDWLKREGHSRSVRALPDCVDTALFDPSRFSETSRASLRARLGIPDGRAVVVYLGLLGEHQGISLLLRAAGRLSESAPDIHFLVMGYPSVETYRKMAAEMGLGDRVTFTGKVRYEEAPFYLFLGDVAAAPKVSDSEGHGKLLNYMAMQLPTVAFDAPVSREYLGEQGRYATFGDAESLAQHLAELVFSEDRASVGEALRRRVEAYFSCETMGASVEAALLPLVGAGGQDSVR